MSSSKANTGNAKRKSQRDRRQLPWDTPRLRPLLWLRDHRRIASDSLHHISARMGTSFLVWLLVGIALALPAGLWVLRVNMEAVTAEWQGRPGLSIYFSHGVSSQSLDVAQQFLSQQPGVESVALITPQMALEKFKAYSGLDDTLDYLEDNPLPAEVRAHFIQEVGVAEVERLIQGAQRLDGVAEVVVEKTWLERLNDISKVVLRLSVLLAVLFGLGAVLVTASSVRLAIESRLDEMKVLLMVGATRGQMRRPFLYFGAMYGFGGGVIAAMLLAFILVVIEGPLQSLLGSYQQRLELVGFDPIFLLSLLSLGASLGILGAMLAVRQRLKGIEII